jgi:hypothetical protein
VPWELADSATCDLLQLPTLRRGGDDRRDRGAGAGREELVGRAVEVESGVGAWLSRQSWLIGV